MQKFTFITSILVALILNCSAQTGSINGIVISKGDPVPFASVVVKHFNVGGSTDMDGNFQIDDVPFGTSTVLVSSLGYAPLSAQVVLNEKNPTAYLKLILERTATSLDEVVISGTMKEMSKLESPVPVEVYSQTFFVKNPTPSVFESLQNVNGVRPQLNCNVCNTGDIHINGLEGPYTMVLIDGMPIVSGLSTVYGLTGIPQSLIERVEVVKGPASTLYGSEAVGGLINIITKNPMNAPLVNADVFTTGWGEVNTDLGIKLNASSKSQSILGINYFNYQNPIDNNRDGFTDITLQDRISIFNKWNFLRKNNKEFSLAGRYVYEDRWGGQMNWTKEDRGGDEVYGESIYTNRWDLMGNYQLPTNENISFQFSGNGHHQNSVYGNTFFIADQYIGFGQLVWNKNYKRIHDLTAGAAFRYVWYDDNTTATSGIHENGLMFNEPSVTYLPGVFIQDEISTGIYSKALLGVRYDHNSLHGSILSPRANFKWSTPDNKNIIRLGIGNGYRVVNIFTEDHAALTGARNVVFVGDLSPETSWNTNINYIRKLYFSKTLVSLDATLFYTYFNNRIIADYDTDPNLIIYENLNGHAISQGVSLNVDVSFLNGLNVIAGFTAMDVYSKEEGVKTQQILTESFSGVWSVGYQLPYGNLSFDYTGNIYGPMRLPLLGELDPRPGYSPWYSIQNLQVTKKTGGGLEIYMGVKNLLNYTPPSNSIARAHDPFDKQVEFDQGGNVLSTPNNPYALTFDPSYVFAPNQGIRWFLGVRYRLK